MHISPQKIYLRNRRKRTLASVDSMMPSESDQRKGKQPERSQLKWSPRLVDDSKKINSSFRNVKEKLVIIEGLIVDCRSEVPEIKFPPMINSKYRKFFNIAVGV